MIISKWRESTPASKLVGRLDQIDRKILRGWIFDPSRPAKRLTVDVFCQGVFLGQATAGFARPDLETAGFGDGRFQFLMDLSAVPETALNEIVVTVSQRPDVEISTQGIIHHERSATDPSSGDELRAMLEPLLQADDVSRNFQRPVRSRHPSLLVSSAVFGVPLSAFARHVASKFGWARDWTQSDFNRFLDWYVSEYAVSQAPRRVPWSEAEIAFWSATASHREKLVCRAQQRFSPRAPGRTPAHAVYAWAIEDSRRLFVEDIFVRRELAAYLEAVPLVKGWRRYPLSRFMRLFLGENGRLRNLPTRTVAERQIVYAVVMLYGLVSPHLLTYVPSRWLAAMLDDSADTCLFREAMATLGLQTAEDVAETYTRKLERRGYDVRHQQWLTPRDNGTKHVESESPAFDVQLIGPFTQTLGLGESARRIAAALVLCETRVNLVDYDLGNAGPRQPVDLPLGPVSTAKVTILHLNLEEIPEALSRLPETLSRSYLIAFPYFELSAPSAAHELGVRLVQEIWVASTFLQSLFAKVCERTCLIGMPARVDRPTHLTYGPHTNVLELLPANGTFTFLTTGDALSWVQRKNVLGVLDAFQAAFDGNAAVRLLIKTQNRAVTAGRTDGEIWETILDRVSRDERVILVDETFDDDAYRLLLARADCLISLHRAEGLGLDLLDAMGMGTAVVATAYSGNADFCDSRICWPVSFDLLPVQPGAYPYAEPGHVWAEPKIEDAIEHLRQVYDDANEREKRTERAVDFVTAGHSLRAVSRRIAARLKTIKLPKTGQPNLEGRGSQASASKRK